MIAIETRKCEMNFKFENLYKIVREFFNQLYIDLSNLLVNQSHAIIRLN